jgi:hypothetical protein
VRRPGRRSVPDRPRRLALLLGAGRIAFGAAMVVAPRLFLTAARNPPDQITGSAMLLSRTTGIRDVLLGVHLLRQIDDRESLRSAALLNAAADATDCASLIASTRWPGFFVAGGTGVPVAASASVSFLLLARSLD